MIPPRIGVCSWSLIPSSASQLVESLLQTGARNVQLALDPLRSGAWDETETLEALERAGVKVLSGMLQTAGEDYSTLQSIRSSGGFRPDETWAQNLTATNENAELARRMGLSLVSFHAGFLPEERGDPERAKLIGRLREVIDSFAREGIECALESGQESAATLVSFLEDLNRESAGVNFDPANMILYNMGDPVQALERLEPWVRQIHIKDALYTETPGTWGREVPAGEGALNWEAFFDVLSKKSIQVNLVIEREAGERRARDIRQARELVERQLARIERA